MPKPSKILCIGRNYVAHAEEMNSAVPKQPMVFLKPPSALIGDGDTVAIPPQSQEVHHELELVAEIGTGGKHIPVEQALTHVRAYALGLDMTARDLQAEAKRKGHPWSVAKGFDTFAPLGAFTPATDIPDPQDLHLTLRINGTIRQVAETRLMIFSVAELVAYCSTIFTLETGDLIYTGTPSGVGPVTSGDQLAAEGTRLAPLTVFVQ